MDALRNFAALEAAIHDMADALLNVKRWRHYKGSGRCETVLAHAFKGAMLAQVMIALERAHGTREFDAYRILAAAVVHDIGEGALGDVRYELKLDTRIRAVLEEHERNGFIRFIEPLPALARKEITLAFELQDDRVSFEGRFFNALERMGYVLWAVREYLDGHSVYHEVFQPHHAHLCEYVKEFACVRILYTPLVPGVERILAENKDAVRSVPVPREDADTSRNS